MDDVRIPPTGDGFYAAGKRSEEKRLATLEERYRHEIVDAEQRCELPKRTLRLRRKIGVS